MSKEINEVFKKLGIKPNSTVMLHADAIVAAQLKIKKKNKLRYLQNRIIEFFKNQGTLVVPAFNQESFAERGLFDNSKTPATIGLFYEKFRLNKYITRSDHPFFSCSLFGKNKRKYLNSELSDCFGKNTLFDLLLKDNAQIVNLGCVWQCTLVHSVEQKLGVNYRYFKNFYGIIKNKTKKKNISIKYYARDLKENPQYDLRKLEALLAKNKKIKYTNFGRFQVSAVSAKNILETIKKNIKFDNNLLLEK